MARALMRAKSGKSMTAAVDGMDDDASDTAVLPAASDVGAEAAEIGPGDDTGDDAAAAAAPGGRALQGFVDKATWSLVEGWAWDPETPEERIRIDLVEDGTPLLTAVADGDRPGLALVGIGDGRHAFSIALEPGLLASGQHVLHLRCADTGAAVPGSPVVLDAADEPPPAEWPLAGSSLAEPPASAAEPPAPAFRWHLDQITDKEVGGWIAPRRGPLRHCVVTLREDDRVLVRAVASQFRADLLSAGIGDGCYAFALPMPRALLDGEVHRLEIVEEETGFVLTDAPVEWRSGAGTAGAALTGIAGEMPGRRPPQAEGMPAAPQADGGAFRLPAAAGKRPAAGGKPGFRAVAHVGTRLLFDISDLVYYIGHHPNLTGIQRVQSSIVLSMIDGEVIAPASVTFLSFNAHTRNWVAIPTGFLISLLRDMFLPEAQRLITFPAEEARYGVLPGARPFDGAGVLDDGNPSVLCLLGAAWVQQDYFHRVLTLKRRFGTRFVMTVHDLIPIYARETCDQDTARVFEEFMLRALRHVDHVLSVSENTAKDVRRYLASLQYPEPAITVTQNGSSFAEFLPDGLPAGAATLRDLPERFVLFVATIEGRKNHQLIFDIWRRMVEEDDDPPHLICVGRLGWKATAFVSALVETNYLDGRIRLLHEISDTDLRLLYERCLFTVCPTFYEGWGLPVGESLAMGKICVCSNRTSIPEVAGDCGVYIDIDNLDGSLAVIRDLIGDARARRQLEAKIRRDYVPITWQTVATRVVAACEASVEAEWQEPYPYTALPYSTEVSFGRLDQDTDGTGEQILARIVEARRGHFTDDPLDQHSFLLGETLRAGGAWAQPERWGTWLCHSGGDVVFDLAEEGSQFYYVFVRVRVCGVLHEQPIRMLANSERLWEGRIGPHSKDVMLRVRKRLRAPGHWKLRIGIEVDLSAETRAQIAAIDSRMPTVGLERLIVVPENDLKARLDVLSRFLLSRQ